VAAAEQCQAAIADLPLITVRMGINTGEVQERAGDYFGPPVNRAARLMAAGHGGQVLVASVTAELVPGLVLKNLGEHRLRDLGSPLLIWQLGTEEFPPLRTLDELPGNLPVQRTTFIGRVDEVKQLASLVGTERLVTLTGPGGVGKSRLALQVAAEVAPEFSDGVWFASLAALEEGALAAATVLEGLGVPERRGEPALDTLCGWASARQALVVIDNCEHLLAEVAEIVDRMLEASTTTSILATSQALLGVRGEHAQLVAPLSGIEGVSGDSVELFVDRARLTRPEFDLTDDNESAVAEICERLDHVPLAIELAAARVRGMTPSDIARRLDQRLRLLATTDRLAPGRHRTLDAAVRWSYELLDDTQQQVFDRLCVFAGGFTIEAAEVVVAGDGVDDWEVLDGILALVDKSLVVADETAGDTRYRLLETMRQFGQANVADAGSHAQYRDRHADYYAEFVLSRRPRLQGSGDVEARDAVERELENIRVALRQAADDHTSSRFEALFTSMFTVWRNRLSEGVSWAAELQHRPDLDPAARIVALGFAASVTINGNLALAEEFAAAAEALWLATHAVPPLNAIAVMGMSALMQGKTEVALDYCGRLIPLAADEPDPFTRAQVLGTCYSILGLCGAFDRLADLEQEVTELVDQLDNRYLDASTASSIAGPVVHVTDPERARERLERSYALNDQMGNHGSNPSNALFLAFDDLRGGDSVAAAHWASRSLHLAIDHAPTYIAQGISATVVIATRRSPSEAAVLLGALRTHRARKQQAGTPPEIDAEARYELALRRALGDEFDARYTQGLALDETQMVAVAFTQLDEIAKS
jgi:predicted ATPase